MENITKTCDIKGNEHSGTVKSTVLPVMFDHDQEDGKSTVTPYFEMIKIDICTEHLILMTLNKKVIYGYGAMGYNEYSL